MRFSNMLGKTQREIPAEADNSSHQLMLRCGMINQLAAGVYSYLPLAQRVIVKIENIIRDEMNKAGGQEMTMPVLQPIELWQKTGRDKSFGNGLFTLKDRKERILALGPTHEEVVTDLVGRYVQSYRDLPQLIYQIQTKFRDEPRPRGGLLRVREFTMKDLYSFDADEKGLDDSYNKMLLAYQNLYTRCGLPFMIIEADSGAIGGKDSHEFMLIATSGEDRIIHCPKCGYAANAEKARCSKKEAKAETELAVEEVHTPNQKTIEDVAQFLGVPACQTLKAVFYMADGQFVFVVIRGDLEVNEVKLKNLLKCNELRMATDDEVKQTGVVSGSASPIGLKKAGVIADDSIGTGSNFVAGANKTDYHLKNVNYPRDFKAEQMADIALACAGHSCVDCGGELATVNGIEVGHIFKLGTFLSETLGAYYTDEQGKPRPIVMGCYGIGVGRLMAAAIEQNHDNKGIIWPMAIAPYQVNICPLYASDIDVSGTADKLYQELTAAGIEVLIDDRDESPGVKFNDADLMGIPLRVTISRRSLKNGTVEVKWRKDKEAQNISLEDAVVKIRQMASGAQGSA
jgi:prolyl-tRNA synthetase